MVAWNLLCKIYGFPLGPEHSLWERKKRKTRQYNGESEQYDVMVDGTLVKVDSTMVKVDGTMLKVDVTMLKVDGTMVKVDGTMVKVDGMMVKVDGWWQYDDDSKMVKRVNTTGLHNRTVAIQYCTVVLYHQYRNVMLHHHIVEITIVLHHRTVGLHVFLFSEKIRWP